MNFVKVSVLSRADGTSKKIGYLGRFSNMVEQGYNFH